MIRNREIAAVGKEKECHQHAADDQRLFHVQWFGFGIGGHGVIAVE